MQLNARPPGKSSHSQLKIHRAIYTAELNSKCANLAPRSALNIAAGKGKGTKLTLRKAGKVVHIKNHVPVVVIQEDVDEYESVKSAVNGTYYGRVVEEEKVLERIE